MSEQFVMAAVEEPYACTTSTQFQQQTDTGSGNVQAASSSVGVAQVEGASRVSHSPPRIVRTTDPSVGVHLAIGNSGLSAQAPVTIGERFKSTVSRAPDRPALCYKEAGTWREVTYRQYYALCVAAAKSFLKVGLRVTLGDE